MNFELLTGFFLAMLAIVNPFGKIPVWLQASSEHSTAVRQRLAFLVTTTAFAILLLAFLGGRHALDFFGIDLASFRIGGGIVILLVGIKMVNGEGVEISSAGDAESSDAFERALTRFRHVVVPLAMPLLAGPGSISTAVTYGSQDLDLLSLGLMAGVLMVVMSLVLLALLTAPWIQQLVGDMVLEVQTRLFGLILTAIAAQLVVEGLGEVFPEWLSASSPIADDVEEARKAQEAGAVRQAPGQAP